MRALPAPERHDPSAIGPVVPMVAAVPGPQQPTGSSTAKGVDIEQCLLAFGNALQASHERNARDVLHIVLTAQQEQLVMLMQAIADQRLDYREQLERSIQGYGEQLGRAARQLSEELNPEAILQIGELFHTSAGQITGALGRCERLLTCVIDKQSRLLESLGALTEQVVTQLAVLTDLQELGHSLAGAPVPMPTQRAPPPERHLSLVAGRPDVLADIRDDLDNDDDA